MTAEMNQQVFPVPLRDEKEGILGISTATPLKNKTLRMFSDPIDEKVLPSSPSAVSACCANEKKSSANLDVSKEEHALKVLRAEDVVLDRKPYGREEEIDFTCKLLLVGPPDSGKTMFLSRGFENDFSIQHKLVTALDMNRRIYDLLDPEDNSSNRINVQIWDITCGEAFSCIIASQYRDVQGVFLCYSVTDRQSFDSLPTYLEQIRTYGQHNPCILLLGLQADVKPMSQQEVRCHRYSHHHRRKTGSELKELERVVSYEEGEAFARSHGLLFVEVSSKDDFQIQDAIVSLVYMVLRRVKKEGKRLVAHRPAKWGRGGGFGRSGNEDMRKQDQRCAVS